MAYINQEKKKAIHAQLKPILKRYGVKGSLSVRSNMTLILTLWSGDLDPFGDWAPIDYGRPARPMVDYSYVNVNVYHYQNHFVGDTLRFLSEVIPVMNDGNHDNSDIMSDYFDVGWYVDVNFGRWDRRYECTAVPA